MKNLFIPFVLGLATQIATAQQPTCSFVLVSTQTNGSGVARTDSITYHFQGANTAIVMHGHNNEPGVRLIFDPAARTITQLFEMNGRKGGFVFPMSEKRWPGMVYSEHNPDAESDLRFTGKTRLIEGHSCREVHLANEEYAATAWVAEEIPLSLLRVLSYQSVGVGKSTYGADLLAQMGMKGLPMELQFKSLTDKPDVLVRIMNYRDSADPGMFSSEGYSTTWVEE